ncbi:MAG: undecaprenyl-diphosphate phosphatase [bacterium]
MNIFEALFLGVLQGATEFLPVSSSGHLVLAHYWLEMNEQALSNLAFDILIHVGTLFAVCYHYRENLFRYSSLVFGEIWRPAPQMKGSNPLARLWNDSNGRMLALVIIGSVPTALIGVLWKDALEASFQNPRAVSLQLMVTAVILLLTPLGRERFKDVFFIPVWVAVAVGIAQGIAIIPGISRSGATIALGLLLGVNRQNSADLSFLMSIPAILGAMLFSIMDLSGGYEALTASVIIVGLLSSFVTGLIFLKLLIQFVRRGRFAWFAVYLFPLAAYAYYYFSSH